MLETKEVRSLKIDHRIIYDLIFKQSHSLEGAIAELIQNSCDAGATEIFLELTESGFELTDNGRGFQSKQEIESWFETFGTPHDEIRGNRFGRFRLGRGQVMGFASTEWESNNYKMSVDVRNDGLTYKLAQIKEAFPGCKIVGSWYREQARVVESDLDSVLARITSKMRYMYGVKININGSHINNLDGDSWEYEDDVFMFRTARPFERYGEPSIRIFNLGMHVTDVKVPRVVGDVVTKKHCKLNINRSNILPDCEILAHIRLTLRVIAPPYSQTKKYRPHEGREILMHFINGDLNYHDVKELSIFQDLRARKWYRFCDLAGNKFAIGGFGKRAEFIDDNLHSGKLCLILDSEYAYRFDIGTASQQKGWVELLPFLADRENNAELLQVYENYQEREALIEAMDLEKAVIPDDQLDQQALMVLKALNRSKTFLHNYLNVGGGRRRSFRLGMSSSSLAWTDCENEIVLERSMIAHLNKGLVGAINIVSVIAHEYCHVSDDSTHSFRFYESYHDKTVGNDTLYRCAAHLLRAYDDVLAAHVVLPSKSLQRSILLVRRQDKTATTMTTCNGVSEPGAIDAVVIETAGRILRDIWKGAQRVWVSGRRATSLNQVMVELTQEAFLRFYYSRATDRQSCANRLRAKVLPKAVIFGKKETLFTDAERLGSLMMDIEWQKADQGIGQDVGYLVRNRVVQSIKGNTLEITDLVTSLLAAAYSVAMQLEAGKSGRARKRIESQITQMEWSY